jgi:hypothetical protein
VKPVDRIRVPVTTISDTVAVGASDGVAVCALAAPAATIIATALVANNAVK